MREIDPIIIQELEAQVKMEKILIDRLRAMDEQEDFKILLDCIVTVHNKIELIRTIIS
jgi:hypothetical protein